MSIAEPSSLGPLPSGEGLQPTVELGILPPRSRKVLNHIQARS